MYVDQKNGIFLRSTKITSLSGRTRNVIWTAAVQKKKLWMNSLGDQDKIERSVELLVLNQNPGLITKWLFGFVTENEDNVSLPPSSAVSSRSRGND